MGECMKGVWLCVCKESTGVGISGGSGQGKKVLDVGGVWEGNYHLMLL